MELSKIAKWISNERLNSDKYISLATIKDELKINFNFTARQLDWAIDLYINFLEEGRLSDFYNRSTPEDGIQNVVNAEINLIAHYGWDCTRIWFEEYVKVKLFEQLKKYDLKDEQIDHIFLNICEFSKEQLRDLKEDDDLYTKFSSNLPVWLPASTTAERGWEKGLKMGRKQIADHYEEAIKNYLAAFLTEKEITDICKNSFFLGYFDDHSTPDPGFKIVDSKK